MYLSNSFIILSLTSILLAFLLFKIKYGYWRRRNIETLPFLDILKISKKTIMNEISLTERWILYYRYFKSRGLKHAGGFLLLSPLYIPLDIEIIKSIMQLDFQHFTDRGLYVNEKHDPLTANLFYLGGMKWRKLRKKLTPTFTSGKMKMMFETLLHCSAGLHKVMDNQLGNAVDIKDVLGRFTTDIIGSCAFGLECNTLNNPESEFREKGIAFFKGGFFFNLKDLMISAMPELMKMINAKAIQTDVSEFFISVVKNTVKYREENNISRKDFMHLLIQMKNREKKIGNEEVHEKFGTLEDRKLSMEEIAAQAFIFFEAAFETSSTTMTFCLYELARNRDIQTKARENMHHVLSRYGGKLNYEAIMDMHYLDQVIYETLRKYPPIPVLPRVCTKDYKVPGTELVLKKGAKVIIPVVGIQRDPQFYPDPDKFDPDRFSEINKDSLTPFTFLSFGEGPRICIGKRFGMMQTKVGLIALLLNYEFTVSKKTKEPIQYDPQSKIMSTKGEMWLDFSRISGETIEL